MKPSPWKTAGALVWMSTGLLHCAPAAAPNAQPVVSQTQAKTDIDQRLSKTEGLHSQINHLREKIRPLGAFLRDFGSAVDVKVDQHPGSVFANLLNRLDQVLQDAVDGIVEIHADGSWVLEHPTSQGSHVRVAGQKLPQGEQYLVAISSSANLTAFETLVTVVLSPGGTRLTLTSATFENLQNHSIGLDPCSLSVDTGDHVDFSCNPIVLLTPQTAVAVDHLEYRTDNLGTHAAVHAKLYHAAENSEDAEAALFGTLDLASEPGHPTDIRVCTRGQSCAP